MFSYLIRKSQKLIPNRKFRHFEFRKCVPPNTKTTMRGIAFSKFWCHSISLNCFLRSSFHLNDRLDENSQKIKQAKEWIILLFGSNVNLGQQHSSSPVLYTVLALSKKFYDEQEPFLRYILAVSCKLFGDQNLACLWKRKVTGLMVYSGKL